MIWLRRIINAIRDWWNPQAAFEVPDIGQVLAAFVDDRDWFVWECEQIRRNGYAPWLDHYRFEGTEFAWPDPTGEQRRQVFEASRREALAKYGSDRVNRMVAWVNADTHKGFYPESDFARSPDPFGMMMREFARSTRH